MGRARGEGLMPRKGSCSTRRGWVPGREHTLGACSCRTPGMSQEERGSTLLGTRVPLGVAMKTESQGVCKGPGAKKAKRGCSGTHL